MRGFRKSVKDFVAALGSFQKFLTSFQQTESRLDFEQVPTTPLTPLTPSLIPLTPSPTPSPTAQTASLTPRPLTTVEVQLEVK